MFTVSSGEKSPTISSSSSMPISPLTTVSLTPSNPSPVLMTSVSPLMKRKKPHGLQIDIPKNQLDKIRYEKLGFRNFPRHSETLSYGGYCFGVACRNGKCKFMEDCHKILPSLDSNKSFFGVYDGHNGKKAAEFVAEYLHNNVLEMLKDAKGNEEKIAAIKAAFLKTDQDFLQQGVVSGACCVTAFIQDKELIISNLGDCRAVLCRGGVAEALTNDHKAGREDERERIESQDGFVLDKRGVCRALGILAVSRSIGDANLKKWVIAEPETSILALEQDMEFLVLASDGIWDVFGNQEVVDIVLAQRKTPRESEDENLVQGLVNVSPSSHIRRISLVQQHEEEFLSVQSRKCAKSNSENEPPSPHHEIESPASVSRKTTPLEQIMMKSYSSWAKAACKELVSLAVSRGSMDDITVVIVDLNPYKY